MSDKYVYFMNDPMTLHAYEACLRRDLRYQVFDIWYGHFDPDLKLEGVGEELLRTVSLSSDEVCVLYADIDTVLTIRYSGSGSWVCTIHARSTDQAIKLLNKVKESIPEIKATYSRDLEVAFYALGPQGPVIRRRILTAPTWRSIRSNYSAETELGLSQLMKVRFNKDKGGKLILWSGEAGTGKTFAMRALARQWKNRVDVRYILDPERFFGDASYMQNVLFMGGDHSPALPSAYAGEYVRPAAEPWSLIILEDNGELLTDNAKERTGQGLSRLLNLCDGMIGQGLPVMVLITTNEDLGNLHPAVSRPGRCAANIKFGPLNTREAQQWAYEHRLEPMATRPYTLAELYAMLGDGQIKSGSFDKAAVGFGR